MAEYLAILDKKEKRRESIIKECKRLNESTLIKTVQNNIKSLKKDLKFWKKSGHKDNKTMQTIADLEKDIKNEQWKLDQAKARIEKAFFGNGE